MILKIILLFSVIILNVVNVFVGVQLSKDEALIGEGHYYAFGWLTGMLTCILIYVMYVI